MAKRVDTDQTALIGTVCSGSTLFAYVRQLFGAVDFTRRHFRMHFFLGALRAIFHSVDPECPSNK